MLPSNSAETGIKRQSHGWEEEFGVVEEAPAEIVQATIEQPASQLAAIPPPDATDAAIALLNRTPTAKIRSRLTVIDGRTRCKTIPPSRLSRDEHALGAMLAAPIDIERPVTRGDCEEDPGRPCPWVGCSHHLFLDVNEDSGAIKLNFPHLEVWEMAETCSLDVADRGGVTLEEVGAILNLTRERVRQIETMGMAAMKDACDGLDTFPDRFASPLGAAIG